MAVLCVAQQGGVSEKIHVLGESFFCRFCSFDFVLSRFLAVSLHEELKNTMTVFNILS
jgi:hypothetical protein